jgi:putative chitinase
MITKEQLVQIYPTLANRKSRLDAHFPHLVKAMELADITTPARIAAYLAQIGHESFELRFMSEVWGPTDQQKRYDPPTKLAARLGNTQVGDGYRYRGAGPIQITGRENFRKAGADLGLDLEGHPEQAFTVEVGHKLGTWFWHSRGLNALADAQDFDKITLRINGGYNGKEHRDRYYAVAKKVLGV